MFKKNYTFTKNIINQLKSITMFTKNPITKMVNATTDDVSKITSSFAESNVKIYETYDFSLFKRMAANRKVSEGNVTKIMASINVNGLLHNPIVVNKDFDVIDGQHRLRALHELSKQGDRHPILFVIKDDYTESEMIAYNSYNRFNWTASSFLQHYTERGFKPYVALSKFMSDFPEFNLGASLTIFTNVIDITDRRTNTLKVLKKDGTVGVLINEKLEKPVLMSKNLLFEKGELKMPDNINLVYEMANKIRSFKPYNSDYNLSSFVHAIILIHKIDRFDFNVLAKKIRNSKKAAKYSIESLGKVDLYRESLNSIYNSNVSIDNVNYVELRRAKK